VQTDEDVYLVTDLATGGDLAFHMSREVRFKEDRARLYAAEVVLALEHLHSLGIVYRDLKVRDRRHRGSGRLRGVLQLTGGCGAFCRNRSKVTRCWATLLNGFSVLRL
jgi:serine/threonine protein kinase